MPLLYDELAGSAAEDDVHVLVYDVGCDVGECVSDVGPWSILVHHARCTSDGDFARAMWS